jgi:hypothetical protein
VISYLHCYVNNRPDVDWNTCGQAAIATITDYWGRNPYGLSRRWWEYDSRTSRYYWDDGEAIDAIKNGGYGPDVVFGWGTTGGRIRDALRSYGLPASVGYSGFFSWGWEGLWSSLQNYVYWNHPVPVMVDIGALGGPAFGVHWAICYRIEGGRAYLGNMSASWNATPSNNDFLHAWHCWFLPYGFNHCAVYC